MKPIETFELAIERAEHFVTLYDLVNNTRSIQVRSDWACKFNSLMHWPSNGRIIRVDGKEKNSILIMRECLGIDNNKFTHEFASELLRASVVFTVSAQDRYFHDIIVENSLKILEKTEDNISKEFKSVTIPLMETQNAIKRARQKHTRPGGLIKKAIQKHLHDNYTFQGSNQITKAMKILGIKDHWHKISQAMEEKPQKNTIIEKLNEITNRRNKIVHESDIIVKSKKQDSSAREIKLKKTAEWIEWTKKFVYATNQVIEQYI